MPPYHQNATMSSECLHVIRMPPCHQKISLSEVILSHLNPVLVFWRCFCGNLELSYFRNYHSSSKINYVYGLPPCRLCILPISRVLA